MASEPQPTPAAVTGATRVAGIIGDPVAHSRSPRMQNAAFAALGLDWVYVPFHVRPAGLADAVQGLKALGVRGFNVTVPHKEAVTALLDDVSPAAGAIGAVNTVVNADGRLVGHNTDGEGFSRALHEAHRFRAERSRALVLGAGGSARAVCDQLAREGIPAIRISNRTEAKARELAGHLARHHPDCEVKVLPWSPLDHRAGINWAELIVNTTTVGLKPTDPSPINTNGISPGHIVVDVVYGPETAFLRECRAVRARCVDGLPMLLHQGALAFTLWTGEEAPLEVMREALGAP